MIATIILAAGGSTRLNGNPKQLLIKDNQPLVRRMADMALSLRVGPVVVVVGAYHERIRAELTGSPVRIVYNPDWADGLASSLRTGLTDLPLTQVQALLVLLTDQPHVTADLLRQLITTKEETGRGIAASFYANQAGVPALFDRRYVAELIALTGDVGAKRLIRQYADDCAEVPFNLGVVDLDTQQDVTTWQQSQENS